jgi:phospholipid transport system substrate-binding protein
MRTISVWICGVSLAAGAALVSPGAGAASLAAGNAQAGAGSPAAGASQAGAEQPSQVVESVAQRFLQDLDSHREQYRQNPKLLREAVDRDVLPHFDVQYAARLVLGRHWRDATPQQRQRFISAFEDSMFTNYGNALLEFRTDRLKVLPTSVGAEATNAMVRTVIRRDDGSTVQVNFALHKTPEGWKAWDVVIEGISYIKSFRDDFGAQIDSQGLDAVIQRLEHGEKPPQITGPGAKRS